MDAMFRFKVTRHGSQCQNVSCMVTSGVDDGDCVLMVADCLCC